MPSFWEESSRPFKLLPPRSAAAPYTKAMVEQGLQKHNFLSSEVGCGEWLLRTTTSPTCEAVPGRASIRGSKTCVSLDSRLESNREKEVAVELTYV